MSIASWSRSKKNKWFTKDADRCCSGMTSTISRELIVFADEADAPRGGLSFQAQLRRRASAHRKASNPALNAPPTSAARSRCQSIDWPLALPCALLFGYLLGSIPFGVMLTHLAGAPDIRTLGSGNIGATNVLRTGRKGLAAGTLLGDALKGTVAVLASRHALGQDAALAAALGAFLGHLFPVWLRFRGGKGVATYIGILFALAWPGAIVFCLVWLVVAGLSRYSSLAGLLASAAMPPTLWFVGEPRAAALFLLLTALLWIMHRANIVHLLAGTERKIGRSTPTPKA